MASGYVDWHKRTYTDIIAQSIEKILVDIGAVSVGQVPVNISGQDISQVDINITAQQIERVFVAYSYGAIQSVAAGAYINPGEHLNPIKINARGVLIGGLLRFWGDSDIDNLTVYSNIDGNFVTGFTLGEFDEYNITNPYANIYFLLMHDASLYKYGFGVARGITFDEKFELWLSLPSFVTNAQNYDLLVLYATR